MDPFEDSKQMIGEMAVRAANIPKRFASGFLGIDPQVTLEHIPLVARAKAWAALFNNRVCTGLYLSGQTGCGKSHLAAAILHEVCMRGFGGRWVNLCELAHKFRCAFDGGWAPTEDEVLEEFEGVALVVFDDLGAERPTPAFLEKLYLILKRRQDDMKPIIVTSNYDGKTLRERLRGEHGETADSGERIVAQLKGMVESLGTFPKIDLRRRPKTPVEAQQGPILPLSGAGVGNHTAQEETGHD